MEHTVTEEVTGFDLVQTQILLAQGSTLNELGLGREPTLRGYAIQARVNMETMHADGSARPGGGVIEIYEAPSGRGIRVDGGIRLGKAPPTGVKIASLRSPPLASMIAAMNRESINHYAELLFRNAARGPKRDVVGSVQTASLVLDEFFATKVGADTSRLVFADGSGLSTLDRVTPRSQVQLLGYAHRSSWGPWLHSSLPVAGDSELLRRRMRNTPAEGNLHAKTGTTNDVIALAGYVTAVNGEVLAFSFLYNGRDRWTAKSMIDVMSETLASFGR